MTLTWPDFPDPGDNACPAGRRCRVLLEFHRWAHLSPHVQDRRQPWDDWLTPPLAADLRRSEQPGVTDAERQSIRQQVSNLFEVEAKQALGVPLAVLYDVAQEVSAATRAHSPWRLTADLVLPGGAKLCIRERGHQEYAVCSCYFISPVCSAPRPRRWRLLMRDLIQRFAIDNRDGTFSPPAATNELRRNEETGETILNPRYLTDATWCLDARQVRPWEMMPCPWPEPPPRPRPTVPLHRPRPY